MTIKMGVVVIIPFILLNLTFYQSMYSPVYLEDSSSKVEFNNQLELKISKLLKTYNVPGISIALISNESIEYIIEGKANFWRGTELTENNLFQIASMSKTHCAFAIMKLVQEGLVNLDVPVESYLTRWSLPETEFDNNEVTIRRILCHASGLSLGGVPAYLSQGKTPSIEEALTRADVKLIYEPGTTYSYSGGGYAILQLVIEEVTGMTYDEYLHTEIFQPLNLTNTWADWSESIDSDIAKGYGSMYFPIIKNFIAMKAAAGHYSSIIDMVKWCNLLLQGQSVLNTTTVENMLTPQWGEQWGYTLGFHYQKLDSGLLTIGHGGDNWGYHGLYRFIPETGDGIVILTNGDRGAALRTEIFSKWEKVMGGSSLELSWKEETRKYMLVGIYELIGSILFIVLLIILGRFGFVSLNQKEVRETLSKTKRLWFNIIRWFISVLLALVTALYILRWGWLNGPFTWRPPNYIWNITIPIMWMFWSIIAVHFISLSFKKKIK
ncbi:MAG: serine hydrolase domain-containing protein [Candidatus Thorarchaeota archaeon]